MHVVRTLVAFLLAFGGSVLSSIPALAQVKPPEVHNPGFEERGPGPMPLSWSLVSAPSPGTTVRTDTIRPHAGVSTLLVEHAVPGTTTLQSDPLRCEVGKLYRVSAWIRTERAHADPTTRYPTAVAATITMESFPFTNHATVIGGTQEWTRAECLFFATQGEDRVRLHLGLNGKAGGRAWFDDVTVERVNDITTYIPMETVRWFGPAYRFTDRGWIFVHIEGTPYQRGFQYGHLLAPEIAAYMEKLAIRQNSAEPRSGWGQLRTLTDALMLRLYDPEYLEEMKGIADGAADAGAAFGGNPVDVLDIVTINSAVDLGQLRGALVETPHALSGRSFSQETEEARASERLHKCSSFLANGPATRDGRIVFGQLFMWDGYTGVHWNVLCDVAPSRGHRLVYQTFPGGIHSGADFYINSAGIMMGETTVMQTPFDMNGEPQSSRIRKAAQYAGSIDEAVRILTTRNNGLYTNDWLIGDVRANEIAILLLGTRRWKLWRSSTGEFPGNTKGFYWSVNNAKDPEVRKEYVTDPGNAPYDVVFGNSNRDIAFVEYYHRNKGTIDAISAVNVMATSPVNRPHACDGKITTAEMAERMMFLAHYGKVTLREKFPEKDSRRMPDLPHAIPHLTLGYSVVNPVYVTDELKKLKRFRETIPAKEQQYGEVAAIYSFPRKDLWMNTVYPAGEGDNWFVSGTAAYHSLLQGIPEDLRAAVPWMRDQQGEMSCRLQYVMDREGTFAPRDARRVYDRYNAYLIPRLRGTVALHQLRLLLGNSLFGDVMRQVHASFREKSMTTEAFLAKAGSVAKRDVSAFVRQWTDRDDLPDLAVSARASKGDERWRVLITVAQKTRPYEFLTTVAVETDKEVRWFPLHVRGDSTTAEFSVSAQPVRVTINAGNDIPLRRTSPYTLTNLFDDFRNVSLVYGTARQIEAHHTLALRYQSVIADQFVEYFLPVRQDNDVAVDGTDEGDLVLLSVGQDNSLALRCAAAAGVEIGKGFFRWQGKTYSSAEDGVFTAFPHPVIPARVVYLFHANSALQLYQMTKRHQPLPSWGIFRGENVVERGYFAGTGTVLDLE